MKIFILLLLSSPLVAFAQLPKTDTSARPFITAPAMAAGTLVSKKIGPAGGEIHSGDMKLRVIFPVGSLIEETSISIQALINPLNPDSSGSWRLEPSGINFSKPVKLVFHYSDRDNNSPKGIATQEKNGQWIGLKNIQQDTVQRTVTGNVQHFSDWALFNHYDLVPVNTTLYVDQSQLLEIRHLTLESERAQGGSIQFGVPLITEKVVIDKWTVNGIEGGNSETGMISEAGKRWGIYIAPSTLPQVNPVTVTAYFKGSYFDLSGNKFKDFSLSSSILIKERGFKFTYIHKNFAGCFHTIDSSTCTIRFDSKQAYLSDIVNHKPWSDWDPCTKCNHQYTNKETFKANVEIWGMAGSKITPPADASSMTDVYITLVPSMGNTPAAEQQCPKSPKVVMPSFAVPANPKYIHFETRGDNIIVHYMGKSGRNMIHHAAKNEETIIKVERE